MEQQGYLIQIGATGESNVVYWTQIPRTIKTCNQVVVQDSEVEPDTFDLET